MALSYINSGEPMTGTAGDDFFSANSSTTGTENNTVNGNDGDDLVLGDGSNWALRASTSNGSMANAHNLEEILFNYGWFTAENALLGDWTIPHTTAIVEATIG